MDSRGIYDLFLPDEKFDFDVSLSPASSTGCDEDEVFVGLVGHKERCVSVNVASQHGHRGGGQLDSWSPLTGDELDVMCQEAHKIAGQLKSSDPNGLLHKDMETTNTTADKEEFIHDAHDKLGMLSQTTSALSPIKRQTFCVQDSPVKQLPPAIQHRLLKGSGPNKTLSSRPPATSTVSSTHSTARISTSSPVAHTKAQPRTMLRGKSSLVVGVVLPNKPVVPTALCSANKGKVEKQRLQPPRKTLAAWRLSPTSRPASRAESCEDLLSDSASVASDISDSSLNSSLLGKRTLAPPTKNVVRNLSGVKAPPLQSRKNTSSSSSSVSSFNSSMSLSPAKGKLNSSLNRSVSSSTAPTPSSVRRPSNGSRSRRSTVYTTTGPASSSTGRRKLSEVELPKAVRSTPQKKAEGTPVQPTPTKRVLERTSSIPPTASVRLQGGLKAKTKPEALVAPKPSGVRGVHHGDDKDASKMLPKRLMSLSGMDSLPQKQSVGPLTPSASDCRSLQVKVRRPSALPTPVRRKMSSIPTPTSQSRSSRLLPTSDSDPFPSCSPVPAHAQEVDSTDAPVVVPFCLEDVEEMEHSAAPPCSAALSEQSQSPDPAAPSQDEPEPERNLIELDTAEESKTQEILLLDLPAPTLLLQEKLLIDLTNTPDLIRNSSKNGTTSELIDLSSPLIKWSPEDKKENAPLINLSF